MQTLTPEQVAPLAADFNEAAPAYGDKREFAAFGFASVDGDGDVYLHETNPDVDDPSADDDAFMLFSPYEDSGVEQPVVGTYALPAEQH